MESDDTSARPLFPTKMKLRLGSGGLYNKALSVLPKRLAGRIDFSRPILHEGWGGPMNGQVARRDITRELFRAIAFESVVETGTFRGMTTQFLAALTDRRIVGIEAMPRFAEFARRRCVSYENVEIVQSDSRSHLKSLMPELVGPVFFYLDAHWYLDLPLHDELWLIADSGIPSVVMVDDFEVPDDPGYGFDDYGAGKRLSHEILLGAGADDWGLFYPSTPSGRETGVRRGCAVIASPSLADVVAAVPGLRTAGTVGNPAG